jgi:hypothetical protein
VDTHALIQTLLDKLRADISKGGNWKYTGSLVEVILALEDLKKFY